MLAALFESAYPKLTAVAAGILGRQEGAEDVVQYTASVVLTKSPEFQTESGLLAWIYGVVRRCALNERRKTFRRRTYATDPVHLKMVENRSTPDSTGTVDPSTGELLEDQMGFEDQLLAALQDLTGEARCCLLLRTVHELSYAEIAEILEIPQGTAMSHVHRSRQLLRKRLTDSSLTTQPPAS